MNNIDSTARIRLPARGHLLLGVLMADFGLMGGVCNEVTYDFVEKDKVRRSDEGRGSRDEVEQSYTSEAIYKWLSA
jgi:hypothetical protein